MITIARSWSIFDLPGKENQLSLFDEQISVPGFWDDVKKAQEVNKTASNLRDVILFWKKFASRLSDVQAIIQSADPAFEEMISEELRDLTEQLEEKLFLQMLSGEHDERDAILAIHAGAGGTDSQDWAEMLQRMYTRWAGNKGFSVELLDLTPGEEAGIKSVTLAVNGKYAFGYLRSEKGVHRLVRLSPFDAAHRRHTSFSLVEVLPRLENDDNEVVIDPNDITIDVYRSSGAGGQNVQKNSTAIRITHIPTGIVVTCQNERSQGQNREVALSVLRSRLLQIKLAKQEADIAVLKGDYTKAEWGSQIRSYVIHPYQLVKDHRTGFESGNAQAVLDGALDKFMEEFLKKNND